MSTKRFRLLRDNDERAEWFFTLPVFLHTKDCLLYFLHECYFKPNAPYAFTLPFQPPFNPWLVVFNTKLLPAPSFLHWIYHHLPTSAFHACQAVWALVEQGDWTYAKVFLECGADPAALWPYAISGNLTLQVPPHLSRRCEKWPTASIVSRSQCSCGHECAAQQAGPAQAEVLDLLTTYRRRLSKGATKRFKPAPDSRVLQLSAKAPSHWKINLDCFMLPQNGTVGRLPTPYGKVGQTLATYSTARHRGNLVAAFADEYLEQLFQTFEQLYSVSQASPSLASHT